MCVCDVCSPHPRLVFHAHGPTFSRHYLQEVDAEVVRPVRGNMRMKTDFRMSSLWAVLGLEVRRAIIGGREERWAMSGGVRRGDVRGVRRGVGDVSGGGRMQGKRDLLGGVLICARTPHIQTHTHARTHTHTHIYIALVRGADTAHTVSLTLSLSLCHPLSLSLSLSLSISLSLPSPLSLSISLSHSLSLSLSVSLSPRSLSLSRVTGRYCRLLRILTSRPSRSTSTRWTS